MSEATAIKDLREALARAQRAEDRVAELERDLKQADESYEAIRVHNGARMNLIDELQARVTELEEALREITATNFHPSNETPFQFEQRIHKVAADALMALAHKEETP